MVFTTTIPQDVPTKGTNILTFWLQKKNKLWRFVGGNEDAVVPNSTTASAIVVPKPVMMHAGPQLTVSPRKVYKWVIFLFAGVDMG